MRVIVKLLPRLVCHSCVLLELVIPATTAPREWGGGDGGRGAGTRRLRRKATRKWVTSEAKGCACGWWLVGCWCLAKERIQDALRRVLLRKASCRWVEDLLLVGAEGLGCLLRVAWRRLCSCSAVPDLCCPARGLQPARGLLPGAAAGGLLTAAVGLLSAYLWTSRRASARRARRLTLPVPRGALACGVGWCSSWSHLLAGPALRRRQASHLQASSQRRVPTATSRLGDLSYAPG